MIHREYIVTFFQSSAINLVAVMVPCWYWSGPSLKYHYFYDFMHSSNLLLWASFVMIALLASLRFHSLGSYVSCSTISCILSKANDFKQYLYVNDTQGYQLHIWPKNPLVTQRLDVQMQVQKLIHDKTEFLRASCYWYAAVIIHEF